MRVLIDSDRDIWLEQPEGGFKFRDDSGNLTGEPKTLKQVENRYGPVRVFREIEDGEV